jgi:hypothetical protein
MNLLLAAIDINQSYDPNWIGEHAFGFWFLIAFVAICIADVIIKYVLKTSFSEIIWSAAAKHPTLIMGGCIATFGIAYLVRDQYLLVLLVGLAGGHLFSGISPTPVILVTTPAAVAEVARILPPLAAVAVIEAPAAVDRETLPLPAAARLPPEGTIGVTTPPPITIPPMRPFPPPAPRMPERSSTPPPPLL